MLHPFARFSPLFVFHIRGTSMVPAFQNGDKVLVLRFIYICKKPHIGEVVIAKDPRDGKFLLKRITKIEKVNHYSSSGALAQSRSKSFYFLSGDNKHASTDSRDFGMIDRSGLIGKVICKI